MHFKFNLCRYTKAIEEGTAERAKLTEDVKSIKEEFKTLEDGAMEAGLVALVPTLFCSQNTG